jgi:hypothetical protein
LDVRTCHYKGAWLAILIPIILITDSHLMPFLFTVFPESQMEASV